MATFPYRLSDPEIPTLGLIVLQVDETIEHDFRRFFPPETSKLHVSRVPSGDELTPETIATMERTLPVAAGLLPPAGKFDVIGYACTSGTTLIGADRVRELVSGSARTLAVTNPLTAALAAVGALGLRRIGIISPYVQSVAEPIRDAFEAKGIQVSDMISFGEEVEARVARIDPCSIYEAALALAQRAEIDGLFLSCTNLRTFDIIAKLEAELSLPILSSNQVLAWHFAQLSGAAVVGQAAGRLFAA